MTQAPFRVPSGTTRPLDSLQAELNAFADRGFPMGVGLSDAYSAGKGRHGLVPSGVLWGTTNVSSFVANASNMTALTTVTISTGVLVAVPFIHDVGFGIGGMGFRVTTGAANAKAVFGLYDSLDDRLGNPYPGKKLWQSTERTPTANNTTHEEAPNVVLAPGHVYWIAYHCGTAAPTITALATAGTDTVIGHISGVGGIGLQTYLSGSRTYSATLPTLYPSGQTAVATKPPAFFYWYTPALKQTFARSFPVWSPTSDGYVVRGMRLLGGTTIQSGASRPSVKVSGRIVNASGAVTLGTFDSTKDVLKPGVPFYLTDPASDSAVLKRDTLLEVYVEQSGWPLLSVNDCRVCCEVVRTRP